MPVTAVLLVDGVFRPGNQYGYLNSRVKPEVEVCVPARWLNSQLCKRKKKNQQINNMVIPALAAEDGRDRRREE